MTYSADLLLDVRADLGEGPLWDEVNRLLYWVDINKHTVNIYDPAKHTSDTYDVGQMVGTVVLREDGDLMLATQSGFARFSIPSGSLEIVADPESDKPENRFNDGKCDPAGRFWAGTMHIKGERDVGALYRLNRDLTVRKMIDNITISNGIVWTADHATMYYIDSPRRTVTRYDFDNESGEITNGEIVITVPKGQGFPDGMAIDAEGMLWIAHYDGGAVWRWNPETGKQLTRIDVPVSRPTACAFGGEHLDTLYITTAINGLDPEQHAKEPHAGSLFVANPGITGTTTYRFKG